MILRFRHKGLERFFGTGDQSGICAQHARKISQILAVLNSSSEPAGMNLPGFRPHPLKGDRKGQWAVSVSGNWRIVFEFNGENATNVDLLDCH
ncbi:MAG: type II toxin-antitoxin system RelE/ParE family toxin [Desulfovibrionaceae bacterium]|nr:type II toxin-antitoxin system RelE/ParE family toxin [Desulfovibrionaceae bacterium]MBF0514184.1 type II toxin-antitoxin system RelE/ParE family toxin [Desulfovibrionaceae bacterium]